LDTNTAEIRDVFSKLTVQTKNLLLRLQSTWWRGRSMGQRL